MPAPCWYLRLYHNLDEPEAEHFKDVGGVPIMRNDEVALRPATPDVLTELYTQEAVGFISRSRDKPFFLYLAHTMPHVPLAYRRNSRVNPPADCMEMSSSVSIGAPGRFSILWLSSVWIPTRS